ncbi:DoxX family protein [Nocardia sp. NPDC052278]|uniref:DoxX family protein n=1 Tax=unclassified Nocardia TaxID=2637762 RepID=UPI0036C5C60E
MGASDLASLALRTVVGATMVAHGIKHARSLEGTGKWFASIGFRNPELQAKASAVVEIGSGAALVAGVATPLAGAAVVGTMVVAARSVHVRNGFFITAEGYEYVLNLAAASVALGALGGGRFSVDRILGRDTRGTGLSGALVTAGLGVAGGLAQLALYWKPPSPATYER